MMNLEEQVKELFSDKEFLIEFLSKKTVEEAKELLSSKGLEMSLEDIELLGKCIANCKDSGEISDEILETISGGRKSFKDCIRIGSTYVGLAISFPVRAVTTTIGAIFGGGTRGFADGWIASFKSDKK